MTKRNYDSTIARMAGNILAGVAIPEKEGDKWALAMEAVELARQILVAIQDTEDVPNDPDI
jgi:hypothetical protein